MKRGDIVRINEDNPEYEHLRDAGQLVGVVWLVEEDGHPYYVVFPEHENIGIDSINGVECGAWWVGDDVEVLDEYEPEPQPQPEPTHGLAFNDLINTPPDEQRMPAREMQERMEREARRIRERFAQAPRARQPDHARTTYIPGLGRRTN